MSLAKRCDRCGKFYDHYPNPTGSKPQYNAVRRVQTARDGATNVYEKDLDLCQECMRAFNEFLDGGKFENEST